MAPADGQRGPNIKSSALVERRFSGCWLCHWLMYAIMMIGTGNKAKHPTLWLGITRPTKEPTTKPIIRRASIPSICTFRDYDRRPQSVDSGHCVQNGMNGSKRPVADIGFSNNTCSMKLRLLPLLTGLLSLVGCANPNRPIETKAGNLSQAQVDAIVERCGGTSRMAVIEGDMLTIKPASDLTVTGCVLKALHATGETSLPTVDNQRYETPERR